METECSLANVWQAKVSTGSARLGLPTEQVLHVLVGATALGFLTRRGFFDIPSPGLTTKPDFVGVPALGTTKPGFKGMPALVGVPALESFVVPALGRSGKHGLVRDPAR